MTTQIFSKKPKIELVDQKDRCPVEGSFRLLQTESGGWSLVDKNQQVAYSGSLENCQLWLDRTENEQESAGFWSFLQSLFANKAND